MIKKIKIIKLLRNNNYRKYKRKDKVFIIRI